MVVRNLSEIGVFTCHIPNLPLPPSTYAVGFGIKVNEALADISSNIIELKVTIGDYFKTGMRPSNNVGVVYVDANWEISSEGAFVVNELGTDVVKGSDNGT